MIIQPTHEQTRRITRKRVYSGPGFGPGSFSCLGIGLGLGLGFGGLGSAPFDPRSIDLAANFSGLLWALQADRAVTYDAMLGSASATLSLTGTRTGSAYTTPIWVTCPTTGGARGTWVGAVSYDEGATVAQTFTSAATVALTGLGTGLTLNIGVGAVAPADQWKATARTIVDTSVSAASPGHATAASQPIITVGANGCSGVRFDGTASQIFGALDLAAPSVGTPHHHLMIVRTVATAAGVQIISSSNGGTGEVIYHPTAGSMAIQQFNASGVNQVAGMVANTWYVLQADFTASTADFMKVGTGAAVTGANAGAADPPASRFIGSQNGASFWNGELIAYFIYTGAKSSNFANDLVKKFAGAVNG